MAQKNVKEILTMLLVLVMMVASGCSNSSSEPDNGNSDNQISSQSENNSGRGQDNKEMPDSDSKAQGGNSQESGKILVAYFSHSGNTKKIAEEIQSKTGGELFEIRTVKEYSSDYNTVLDEAKAELNEKARPELSGKVDNIEQYQTVIIGYPIWWGKEPMIIRTFLESYNLKGKKIVPFCTSGGSGISGSMKGVKAAAKGAKVVKGKDLTDLSSKSVAKWAKKKTK